VEHIIKMLVVNLKVEELVMKVHMMKVLVANLKVEEHVM
jgi:hypothetical protein